MEGLETNDMKNKKVWLPIPGVAVPVRVVMEEQSELNLLARTLVRLLEIRPRSLDELSRKMGLEKAQDLVILALQDLEDRNLVEPSEAGSEVFHIFEGIKETRQGSTIKPAWAFISLAGQPQVLPELWLSKKLPHQLSDGKIGDRDFSAEFREFFSGHDWRARLGRKEVERQLQSLAQRDGLIFHRGKRGHDADDSTEGEAIELPWISRQHSPLPGEKIRWIEVDPVRSEPRLLEWVPLWSMVEFLPRIAAPATVVFRDLQVEPKMVRPRPINVELHEWLGSVKELRPFKQYIQNLAEAMREDFSIVLKLAGIESPEKLEKAVDEHVEKLAKDSGVRPPKVGDAILGRQVDEKIRDAWRWYYIARQNEDYTQQALDGFARVIEAVAQALRDLGLKDLQRWRAAWDGREKKGRKEFAELRRKRGWQNDRLGIVGISASELGPSLKHLESAMQQLSRLPRMIDEAESQGAGNSITLWLASLFLADDEPAKEYALPIREALSIEPMLFERIDSLLGARNDIVHDRADLLGSLDQLDRWSYSVWAAVEAGYAQAQMEA